MRVRRAPSGEVRFLAVDGGLRLPATRAARPSDRAHAFLTAHGALFGLQPADGEVLRVREADETGMTHVRLRQTVGGVPVAGSGLTVHLRGDAVISALGRTVGDAGAIDRRPSLAAATAKRIAAALMADLERAAARLTPPRLELFNRALFLPGDAATQLAWFVEASAGARREWIWIDAHSGAVLLHFNQTPTALFRQVFDALDTPDVPGTLVRSEGEGPVGDLEADRAYEFSGDTYDYYLTQHGRDAYDGLGAAMNVTINSTICGSPCYNAFWFGTGAVFGAGFAFDDFIGHEFTHGVTEAEVGLVYLNQSGALNESFSDIFGETIDLTNGAGSDAPVNRWWIGEDFLPGMLAGLRNMADPTIFADPGKLSDPQVVCGAIDSGGVHSNSGIGNHAYALMVDGGTYNGHTISGIGLTRAAKIEYRALSEYLVPTSTYADNYDALNQSCLDLIGTVGITAADCVEVQKALDAVEMSAPWPCVSGTPTPSPSASATPTATVTATSSATRTVTATPTPLPACGVTPRPGCAAAPRGRVLLRHDASRPTSDTLLWKWIGGTSLGGSFGNPATTTTYTLCVFEHGGIGATLVAEVPAGAGWKPQIAGRFAYGGASSGIQSIKLQPGTGRARILLKGRGTGLGLTTAAPVQPLTLQLVKSDGPECWESVFTAPAGGSATTFKDTLP
ncbi:MAG: M4 family metallopeptidase [Deltaproteobacteria bacterium]|nr:M4 family metallopeptidase [Deltaproteobacteria bacterium]